MQSPLHRGATGTSEGHTHCSTYYSRDPDAAVLLGESSIGRSKSYTYSIMMIMPCRMKFEDRFKSSEATDGIFTMLFLVIEYKYKKVLIMIFES